MPPVEIAQNKTRLWGLAALGLVFAVAGGWLALRDWGGVGRLGPGSNAVIGLLAAVFGLAVAVLVGRQALGPAVGISMDDTGLTVRGTLARSVAIPWARVGGFEEAHISGQRYIVVRLRDAAGRIVPAKPAPAGPFGFAQRRDGAPVTIAAASLKPGPDAVLATLVEQARRHGVDV